MPTPQSINVTLPSDLVDLIESKVRSGEYADEAEVIRDGLRSLADRDAALEDWLRSEVLPTYDAALADPERSVSAGDAWARLKRRMEQGPALPSDA